MADSQGNIARVEGFKANLAVNGRALRRSNGQISVALIADADMVAVALPFGDDPREKIMVAMLKPIPNYARQEQLLLVAEQIKIQLIERKDGPADPIAMFTARKVTADDK